MHKSIYVNNMISKPWFSPARWLAVRSWIFASVSILVALKIVAIGLPGLHDPATFSFKDYNKASSLMAIWATCVFIVTYLTHTRWLKRSSVAYQVMVLLYVVLIICFLVSLTTTPSGEYHEKSFFD